MKYGLLAFLRVSRLSAASYHHFSLVQIKLITIILFAVSYLKMYYSKGLHPMFIHGQGSGMIGNNKITFNQLIDVISLTS